MNQVWASFTTSERNIIVFVLLMMASGYGILEWREASQKSMVFSAVPSAGRELAVTENLMPKGMTPAGRIDINSADGKLLETLPGVGPSLATAILRYRKSNGPLTSMGDLDNVPGIGPSKLANMASLVTFPTHGNLAPAPPTVRGAIGSGAGAQLSIAPPVGGDGKININTADASQLDKLKGVGPALAGRIIEWRNANGRFSQVQDLVRVKGIGPKILGNNAARMTVD